MVVVCVDGAGGSGGGCGGGNGGGGGTDDGGGSDCVKVTANVGHRPFTCFANASHLNCTTVRMICDPKSDGSLAITNECSMLIRITVPGECAAPGEMRSQTSMGSVPATRGIPMNLGTSVMRGECCVLKSSVCLLPRNILTRERENVGTRGEVCVRCK
jgi:hypothetical protein